MGLTITPSNLPRSVISSPQFAPSRFRHLFSRRRWGRGGPLGTTDLLSFPGPLVAFFSARGPEGLSHSPKLALLWAWTTWSSP